MNPLRQLLDHGQSVWLDFIRRNLMTSGELEKLVREDGLRGMTSNPAIFEKAIAESDDYDETFAKVASRRLDGNACYEQIAIEDIRMAADRLKPVYEESRGRDGYVSLEVSPYLANETEPTIAEARRLWKAVGRPNLMIKVPGTAAGLPAITTLISEGINVNVTLLFSQDVYAEVAEAYIAGLEKRAAAGGDVAGLASVASFFISRIDSAVDKQLEARIQAASGAEEKAKLEGLIGKTAIANGKQTYQRYLKIFSGQRWEALAKKGARTQRVLWASTSTKNPKFSDVLYVEELIGRDTVNTIPPATFDAFRDHGRVRDTLTENLAESDAVMKGIAAAGISIEKVTADLVVDGVKLFADAFDKLLAAIENKSNAAHEAGTEAREATEVAR